MTGAGPQARTMRLDDVTLSFTDTDPGGPAVVLLHGGGSTSATWDQLAAALVPTGWRVIAADLRGHGRSSRTADYPLAGYADDVAGLLDGLGIGAAALVGHSLGGYAASVLAQREPGRITRLLLEEPGLPARDAGHPTLQGHGFAFAALTVVAARRRRYDRRAVFAAVAQLRVPDPAWWARLPRVTAPALLISGGPASHIPSRQLHEAARLMPHCSFLTIPAGHRVHSRRPAEFLAAAVPFLTA